MSETPKTETPKAAPTKGVPFKKAASKTEDAPEKDVVFFKSRRREPTMFNVMGIRPIRIFAEGTLQWEVPAEDAERFEQNHFVKQNRVVRED